MLTANGTGLAALWGGVHPVWARPCSSRDSRTSDFAGDADERSVLGLLILCKAEHGSLVVEHAALLQLPVHVTNADHLTTPSGRLLT